MRHFASPDSVLWRQWGDELAVYELRQRRTHLLSAGAAEALKMLLAAGDGCTTDELARQLLAETDPAQHAALADDETEGFEGIVSELVRLGLVESRPS